MFDEKTTSIINLIKESMNALHFYHFSENETSEVIDVLKDCLPKDIEFSTDSGASKFVIIFDTFVLKIPFNGYHCDYYDEFEEDDFCYFEYGGGINNDDYCALEENIYDEINEFCDEEDLMVSNLFAPTSFVFYAGGLNFYYQPRCYEFSGSKESKSLTEEQVDSTRSWCRDHQINNINSDFATYILNVYGEEMLEKLSRTIDEMGIGDLHNGNLGFDMNNKPIIFDYSGYND